MWGKVTSWAGGAWSWFLGSPIAQIGAAALGLLLAWSVAVKTLKEEGKREQKRIHEAAAQKERGDMLEDRTEILDAIHNDVEGARSAVERMPQYYSVDELRKHDPELAALVLGDPDGDGRPGR